MDYEKKTTEEELRRRTLGLYKSKLPCGVGPDAISGIQGVYTLKECMNDLLVRLGIPSDKRNLE